MALIKCPECGGSVSDKAKTCPHCGLEVADMLAKKKCPECGIELPDKAKICPECGFPLDEDTETFDEINIVMPKRTTTKQNTESISEMIEQSQQNYKDVSNNHITKLITGKEIVSLLWILIGIIQIIYGVYYISIIDSLLLDDYFPHIKELWELCILVGGVNIVSNIIGYMMAGKYKEKYDNIIENEKFSFFNIISYGFDTFIAIIMFKAGGVIDILLGILLLAAIVVEIVCIKIYIANNSVFIQKAIKEKKSVEKKKIEYLEKHEDELKSTWICPKCDAPIKYYPCKYCGHNPKEG